MDFAQKVYDHLAARQLAAPGVTLGRALHREVLEVHGTVYAFLKEGRLVVKLPLERAGALVEAGAAVHFEVGRHAMKGWVGVGLPDDHDQTLWQQLLDESRAYVAAKPG
jgi:hypothetical protein